MTNWYILPDEQNISSGFIIFIKIYLGIAACVGFVGNTATLASLASFKKLRTIPNIYLANLAIADLLVCCIIIPNTLIGYYGLYEKIHCRIIALISLMCLMVSVLTLGLVALNRYILICRTRDTYEKIYTTKKTLGSAICAWLYALLLFTPPYYTSAEYTYNTKLGACLFASKSPPSYFFILVCADFLVIFPTLNIMLFCYWKILKKFRDSRRKIGQTSVTTTTRETNSETSEVPPRRAFVSKDDKTRKTGNKSSTNSKTMALVKNLLVITAAFLCSWMPLVITYKIDYYGSLTSSYYHFVFAVALAGSCLNFLIYAFLNRQLKDAYITLATCNRKRNI
ncbi:unnamed protein product [Dimorphilus gyrociliatus]|uniref:G-protein coupled receptors family 1 profile domain-containing protein n=1 Tax=Dimorphilus gyrociliatus TaxID=2664684 RepID=A0A7I8V4V3_9ANNE|nr:unnamed protein product [Dimorphilus gyrociliatus]